MTPFMDPAVCSVKAVMECMANNIWHIMAEDFLLENPHTASSAGGLGKQPDNGVKSDSSQIHPWDVKQRKCGKEHTVPCLSDQIITPYKSNFKESNSH